MPYWDRSRNATDPEIYTYTNLTQIFWQCPDNETHAWQQPLANFLKRRKNCMFCARKVVPPTLRLSSRFPAVAREWHPTLNRHLTPDNVKSISERSAWWQCSKNTAHTYCAPIRSRTDRNLGCPFCAESTVDKSKVFESVAPKLSAFWDLERNDNLSPANIAADSEIIVYFICPTTADQDHPHTIRTSVFRATECENDGLDCVACRTQYVRHETLDISHPHVAAQWHKKKNGKKKAKAFTAGSAMLAWWKCNRAFDHEWLASITSRTAKDSGCPFCARSEQSSTSSFAVDRPDILKDWDDSKNRGIDPHSIPVSYEQKVYWRCPLVHSHSWQASVRDRVGNNSGCPICANQKVHIDNCLATVNPKLARLWHQTLNGELTPYDVTAQSTKRIYFQCPRYEEHTWQVTLASRPTDCPKCLAVRRSKETSLKALHPKIAKLWHPNKNSPITPDMIAPGSNKKYWWICPKSSQHDYETAVCNKTLSGSGCPFCANKKFTPENSLLAVYPKLAAQWHRTKNGFLHPSQVSPKSSKKIWWQCKVSPDHEWKVSPGNRVCYSSGCPFCARRRLSKSQTLAQTYPQIAEQWHPSKNESLTPDVVSAHSSKKVYWQCSNNRTHVWSATISNRTKNGSGCPKCPSGSS